MAQINFDVKPFLRQLKARKAQFGFASHFGPGTLIPLGKMLEELHNMGADKDYAVEFVGMNQTDFRLYTDSPELAEHVRNKWCEFIL